MFNVFIMYFTHSGTVNINCSMYHDDTKWTQLLFVYACVCALSPLWSGLAPLTYFLNFSQQDGHTYVHTLRHALSLSLTLSLSDTRSLNERGTFRLPLCPHWNESWHGASILR